MGVRAVRSKSSDARGVEQDPSFSLQVGWADAVPRHLYVTSSPGVIPETGTVLHTPNSPGDLVTAHTNSVAQGSGQEVV